MPPDTDVQLHHDDHATLLDRVDIADAGSGPVDAIIVPSFRRAEALDAAFAAAKELRCRLVIACTTRANARQAAARAGEFGIVPVVITLEGLDRYPLPAFGTNTLLYGTRFQSVPRRGPADTSAKRNIGLLLARMVDWRRVVFLDDDIVDIDVAQLRAAAGLLDRYDAVGLGNHGYPDNSVVCHAHRLTGGAQGAFIGAGALAVRTDRMTTFFPDVYNEDWLFLAEAVAAGRVAVVGEMAQQDYDPFANPRRARQEEFGDCLGEGLFWLLDGDEPLERADEAFWTEFIGRRRRFIGKLRDRVLKYDIDDELRRGRMLDSLAMADESNRMLTAQRIVAFLAAWATDRMAWRAYVAAKIGAGPRSVEAALLDLGLEDLARPAATIPAVAPVAEVPGPVSAGVKAGSLKTAWRCLSAHFRRPSGRKAAALTRAGGM